MNDSNVKRECPFRWRGLTSLLVTLGFIVIAATGVVLYVSPQGRVANWTGWSVLGIGKEQWAAVHTTAALLFVFASAFHIYFNWSTLACYLGLKRRLHYWREFAVAAVVVAAVLAGTLAGIPPLGTITDLNDRIKAHWESRSEQAPYPHAEASTVADFAKRMRMPLEDLAARLATAGAAVADPESQTLDDLARARGVTPRELFGMISAERVTGVHGQGLGQLTVRELCENEGLSLDRALEALKAEGYDAEASSALKELAGQKGVTPAEVKAAIVRSAK